MMATHDRDICKRCGVSMPHWFDPWLMGWQQGSLLPKHAGCFCSKSCYDIYNSRSQRAALKVIPGGRRRRGLQSKSGNRNAQP